MEGVAAAGMKERGSARFKSQAGRISPDKKKNEVIRRNTIQLGADNTATCRNGKGDDYSIEPSSRRAGYADNLTLMSTEHCTHSTLSHVLRTSNGRKHKS